MGLVKEDSLMWLWAGVRKFKKGPIGGKQRSFIEGDRELEGEILGQKGTNWLEG